MYSVFFFGEALWPQVEYPLGTLCDSPNGAVEAMVKSVRGEAPRGVAKNAANKAPFVRPSIKGVHHAGMHA